MISGRVEMDSEDGLQPDEKAGGYVLTCVGRPATDCVVDCLSNGDRDFLSWGF